MAQYTEGQRLKGSDGNIYVVKGGVPVLAPQAMTPTNPLTALKTRQQMIDVQKGQSELQKSPYEIRKEAADAAKAELDLKTAQEAYASQHPKGSTATVLGPDSLKALSPPDQEIVKALADGRLAFPAGFALKAPWWQQKLEQVAAYDPSFDATNFNNRAKARAMLLTGKVGTSANALNTSIGHLGLLNDQVSGTASHAFTPANAVINKFEQLTGDPGITNFKDTAGKLASELTSVYRNGGGAEQDVIRQLQSLDPNASEQQKRAVIKNALDLLASKQAANLYQYSIGSGGKPEVDLLDPAARKVLDQFPDIRDKYFAQPSGPISKSAAALLQAHGATPPPSAPPAPSGPPGAPPPPPTGPNAPPPGTPLTPASGPTKTEFSQTGTDKQVAAMLAGGVPGAKIKQFVSDNGANYKDLDSVLAWRALNPKYKGSYDVHSETVVPTTVADRFAASPTSAFIHGIADAGTAGLSDEATGAFRTLKNGGSLSDNIAAANLEDQTLANANPGASLAGNIVGGTGAMVGGGLGLKALLAGGAKGGVGRNFAAWMLQNPIKSAALGDTAYGTAYGAGENNDNRALGAGVGGLVAPIASVAGAGASNVIGKTLTGVVDPAVQRLRAMGIPLTVGETLGGGFKKAQDAMTSVFGPGNMVARRYADGRRALNQAAFNTAGTPIGATVNDVGQAGINALDQAKNDAYSKALDPVQLNLNDPQFLAQMQGALDAADKIPGAELPEGYGGVSIRHYVGNQTQPDGTMTGPAFQNAYRGLSQTAAKAAPKIEGHDIGQAITQAKDALTGTLETQNPGAFQDFLNANAANRNLNVLANATNAAKNQVSDNGEILFTPAQLGTAATANAKRYSGNIAAAAGNRPFNQLATDAQQVMSSKLPESGTVPRLVATTLATGGLTGTGSALGYGANGDSGAAEGGLGTMALLTALGTRKGQQLLTAALLKRTVADQMAGRAIGRNPQIGASILASAGIPLLDSPSP